MANVIGDIAISIGADIAPLVTNLGRAKGQISQFGASAETAASGGMGKFTAGAAMMGAAVAAAGLGLVVLAKRTLDTAGALHDASQATGVHVASLQAMTQVASEASVSTESLMGSLSRMQNNITSLSQGTKAQVDAFGRLGVSLTDLQGKGGDEQFAVIAAAIDAIKDPAEKTAAAIDVFGKSGADLIPMMGGYAAAVADAAKAQRDFGVSMSDDQAAQLDGIGDSIGRISLAAQGLGNQLLIAFGPLTVQAIDFVTRGVIGLEAAFTDFKNAVTTTDAEAQINKISDASQLAARNAGAAADEALNLAAQLDEVGDTSTADAIRAQAKYIQTIADNLAHGRMKAEDFKAEFDRTIGVVQELAATAQGLDRLSLVNAIGQIGEYAAAAGRALGIVKSLATIGAQGHPDGGGGNAPAPYDTGMTTPGYDPGKTFSGITFGPSGATLNTPSGGGGGGASNLDAELQRLRDQYAAKSDLIDSQYSDDLAKLEEFRNAKLLTEQEYNDLEAQITQKHEDKLRSIHEQAQAVKLSAISGAFGDLSALMQTHNKKLFAIGKAASLASAVVDGYQAATAAWKHGMAIGGPAVAAAFTAASLAKTGAMIAGIQSTTMGGGSGGASAGGGTSSGSGVPAAATAAPATANITLIGQSISSASLGDLVNQLNDAFRQGYRLNVSAA